jgi:hypothetical protein
MKKNIVIYGIDSEVWDRFREWCIRQGIPTAGRNSRLGDVISRILLEKMENSQPPPRPINKLQELKSALDRNIRNLGKSMAPAPYVEDITRVVMGIRTPHLVRYYIQACGYRYDRSRKSYICPDIAPAPHQEQLPTLPPAEREQIDTLLKYATDPAYQVRDTKNQITISPSPSGDRNAKKKGK